MEDVHTIYVTHDTTLGQFFHKMGVSKASYNLPGNTLMLVSFTFLLVLKKPVDQSQVMLEGLVPAKTIGYLNKYINIHGQRDNIS